MTETTNTNKSTTRSKPLPKKEETITEETPNSLNVNITTTEDKNTIKTKNFKFDLDKIFIGIVIILLSACLGFWARGQYQEYKIKNECTLSSVVPTATLKSTVSLYSCNNGTNNFIYAVSN